jgi:hypothetical protein
MGLMYSFITWLSPKALLFFNLLMQSRISICVIFSWKLLLTKFTSYGSIFEEKLSFYFRTNANFNDKSLIFPAKFLPTSENIWYPILTQNPCQTNLLRYMLICFNLIFLTGIINRLHKSYLLKEGKQTHLKFF